MQCGLYSGASFDLWSVGAWCVCGHARKCRRTPLEGANNNDKEDSAQRQAGVLASTGAMGQTRCRPPNAGLKAKLQKSAMVRAVQVRWDAPVQNMTAGCAARLCTTRGYTGWRVAGVCGPHLSPPLFPSYLFPKVLLPSCAQGADRVPVAFLRVDRVCTPNAVARTRGTVHGGCKSRVANIYDLL